MSNFCSILAPVQLGAQGKQSSASQSTSQLTLWQPEKFSCESRKPDLTIAPVPQKIALDSDRFYIACGDWTLPIQLNQLEANYLYYQLARLDWTLDDLGIPINLEQIWTIAESELKELWNTLKLIGEGGAV
ncbi:hypothetical protein H6F51_24780 [Cyanobacteria bacterium FACHB-DQ100]|nr:hypothetical protein [Cyanobacteria bacterium FACHB-DQ100]